MSEEIKSVEGWIARVIPTLEGWSTPEKCRDLARLVIDNDCKSIFEIGIFGGRSLLAMASACKIKGSGIAIGCDPWSVPAALEGTNAPENNSWWASVDLEKIYRGFIEAVLREDLTRQCQWFRLKSEDAVNFFNPHSLDLLSQDGNHSPEVSVTEVIRFDPVVKPGGLWIFDDVLWPSTKRAQEELVKRGYSLFEDHGEWRVYQKRNS